MAYPPAPPSGAPGSPRLRGRVPLRLSIIFGVIGLAALIIGVVIAVKGVTNKVDKFPRIAISNDSQQITSGQVSFGTGGYIAYYEAKNLDTHNVPIVPIRLTSPSGQRIVPSKLYGGEDVTQNPGGTHKLGGLTYEYNGHRGAALWQFNIAQAGSYKVEVAGSASAATGADMAFGRSVAKSTVAGASLLVVGILLLIAAIVLLIVGLVKRSHSKKELAAAQAYYGYGGGPPGYPPPGQPGYPPPGQSAYPPPGQPAYQPPGQPNYPPSGNAPTSLEKTDPNESPWPPKE